MVTFRVTSEKGHRALGIDGRVVSTGFSQSTGFPKLDATGAVSAETTPQNTKGISFLVERLYSG
jgi:hypothetical protein